jgi:4-hydroxybutyrate dehydrogenase
MSLITFVTRVHFADRVLEDALAEELARLGVLRPLVLVEATPGDELERLWDALPVNAVPVRFFVDGGAAADAALREAAAMFAESGCDGIVGCGGARTLDLARLLGGSGAPVVAVPTGTESVGLGPARRGFRAPRGAAGLHPAAILCDATLTLGAVRRHGRGGDGRARPLPRGLSQHGLQPARRRHRARRAEAGGPEPRTRGGERRRRRRAARVAGGRADGGLAAQKGFGGIEAAARGLEGEAGARHGVLHAALLPEVLAFNRPAIAERFALIRSVLGPGDVDVAEALAPCRTGGLPSRLSEAGIAARVLPGAAQGAAADPANRTNPRHATPRDYQKIMEAAL